VVSGTAHVTSPTSSLSSKIVKVVTIVPPLISVARSLIAGNNEGKQGETKASAGVRIFHLSLHLISTGVYTSSQPFDPLKCFSCRAAFGSDWLYLSVRTALPVVASLQEVSTRQPELISHQATQYSKPNGPPWRQAKTEQAIDLLYLHR
jgi:hypothetical protein